MNEAQKQSLVRDLSQGSAQLFPSGMNVVARVSIMAGSVVLVVLVLVLVGATRSSYRTDIGVPIDQPVPFSHEHHVGGLGIDCRYCHTSVEQSSFAGIPPTHTCMTCHSQIWTNSPLLEPVRESYRTNLPILWNRVHALPDFVYFNHSIHVQKGVGCATCHGRVDQMPLMMKVEPLTMGWCLGCHRDPARYLRPREEVFNMAWSLPEDQQRVLGQQLVEEYHVRVGYLTQCYICHR